MRLRNGTTTFRAAFQPVRLFAEGLRMEFMPHIQVRNDEMVCVTLYMHSKHCNLTFDNYCFTEA